MAEDLLTSSQSKNLAQQFACLEPVWTLGLAFIALPVVILALSAIVFLLRMHSSAFQLGAGIYITSLFLVLRLMRLQFSRTAALSILLLFWLTLVAFVLASLSVLDNSFDGLEYHQEYISFLRNGWNPYFEVKPWVWDCMFVKGAEIVGSTVYSTCSHIEAAKAAHWPLYLSSFLLSWSYFALLTKHTGMRSFIAPLLALVAACNPVVLSQLFTTYIDGDVAAAMLSLLASLGIIMLNPGMRSAWFALAFSTIYLVNLKYYAFFYALTALAIGILALFCQGKDFRICGRFVLVSMAAVLIGIAFAFNPYITAITVRHEAAQPFRLALKVTECSQFYQAPPQLMVSSSPFAKLFVSLFCKTDNRINKEGVTRYELSKLEIMPPFVISPEELQRFVACDVRVGAFGPWFGEVLTISVLLAGTYMILRLRRRSRGSDVLTNTSPGQVSLWLACIALVTTLINPMCWWARYVPQLWLVPAMLLAYSFSCQRHKLIHAVCLTTAALCLVNAALVAIPNWQSNIKNTGIFQADLVKIRDACFKTGRPVLIYYPPDFRPFESILIRLSEYNIPYKVVSDPPKKGDSRFTVMSMRAIVYMDRPQTQIP